MPSPDLRRYIHGWAVFFETLRMQRRKRHGKGKAPWRQAIFISRCARWIAAQQHRPRRNPYWNIVSHAPVPTPATEA